MILFSEFWNSDVFDILHEVEALKMLDFYLKKILRNEEID